MTTAAPAAPATASAMLNNPTPPAAPAAPATPPAGGAPATPPAAPAGGGDWYGGFAEDLKGFVQNKGYKSAEDLANAYRNLEKLRGVPQERLLTLPERFYDDAGLLTADGRAVMERLGAVKDPKDYGIEAPKEGGDQKRLENFLKTAHEMGLTKAQAQRLAAADSAYADAFKTESQAAAAARFKQEAAALDQEWGAAAENNKQLAREAANRMGWTAKEIDAVAGQLGLQKTMNLLKQIGQAVGEHAFVSGTKSGNAPLEPATAKAKIAELRNDRDFGQRLMNKDADAMAMWQRLHTEAYPGTHAL